MSSMYQRSSWLAAIGTLTDSGWFCASPNTRYLQASYLTAIYVAIHPANRSSAVRPNAHAPFGVVLFVIRQDLRAIDSQKPACRAAKHFPSTARRRAVRSTPSCLLHVLRICSRARRYAICLSARPPLNQAAVMRRRQGTNRGEA